MLCRDRHRRADVGSELHHPRAIASACYCKAGPQAGQVRPLGQRMKAHQTFGIGTDFRGDLQGADRRRVAIDLGIAFVREDLEVVAFGQFQQRGPVRAVGTDPLRVRGRADVGDGRAVQKVGRQRCEIRQETGFRATGQVNRFGARGDRGNGIALIERVRQQDRRALAILGFRRQRDAGAEQPLARAVQRQDLRFRVAIAFAHLIAPRQPIRDGRTQLGGSLVRGILRQFCGVLQHDRSDKIGNGMLRFAQ